MARTKTEKKAEQELNKLRRRAEKLGLNPDSIDPKDLLYVTERKEEELHPEEHAARKAARSKAEDLKRKKDADRGIVSDAPTAPTLSGGLRKVAVTRKELKEYEEAGILYGYTHDLDSFEKGVFTRGIATIRI